MILLSAFAKRQNFPIYWQEFYCVIEMPMPMQTEIIIKMKKESFKWQDPGPSKRAEARNSFKFHQDNVYNFPYSH